MDNKKTFQQVFFEGSYMVACFLCHLVNFFLGFRVQKLPKDLKNCIVIFNETRVTNGFIPFLACPNFVHHVVMDILKGRWYGGMLRAHLDSVFIDQSSPLKAMREVQRKMKRGESFVLFPEGWYSQDGITSEVRESTGAFIKSLGHTMVTYRISGGYLRFPTWSAKNRRGPVKGEIMGVYSVEQLKAMSPAEITEKINQDLYVNAYAGQKETPVAYSGRKRAEGIENIFSICPKCGGFSTIHAMGNDFSCSKCGAKGSVDKYGFIKSSDFEFSTIPELEQKELELFDQYYRESANDREPFLHFEDVMIEQLGEDYKPAASAVSTVNVYSDRMEIADYVFVFEELRHVRILRGKKNGSPRIDIRTANEKYLLTGGNLCPWQVHRMIDAACGSLRDRF